MVQVIDINLALKKKNSIFIDTRTPKEFELDSLPNAINIPIFSNDERAIIGTLYKQVSQDKAIKKGIEYFSKKMPHIIEEISKLKDKNLIIYCWRGGMRSKTITSLLDSLNYSVYQLKGGYKEYRKYVREELKKIKINQKVYVLHGLTCTGKTNIIKKFKYSLDLEGLALHRGSLFGGIGLIPANQKSFENKLLQRLIKLKDAPYIIIEGEGKRIGNIILPSFIYDKIQNGTPIFVKRDFNLRIESAIKEYLSNDESIKQFISIVPKIKNLLSKEKKDKLINLLKNKNLNQAVKILLEDYYDPLYEHTLKKINPKHTICSNTIDQGVKEIKMFITTIGQ